MKRIPTSLVISTYNKPQYLNLCLKSAMNQTVMPDEIVIADDGSTAETAELIKRYAAQSPVPIVHVWQEDCGFRKCEIMNKAFARCKGEYIIQSDGDIIFGRHFVQDHLYLAERGCFVCGSRVYLTPEGTQKMFDRERITPRISYMQSSHVLNSVRIKPLQKYFACRYGKRIDKLRGCNMAFWKDDIVKVNGYDESLTFWGHEDGELAYRLHFAGVRKKFLKNGAVCFHLYHKESSRENEEAHIALIKRVIDNKLQRCDNGIDKYL
ncbi:MAG: glycosyltransferase family 2 protein [Bacteroidales bacterium]|nr:glycosyltransferase family 2 protein [Bacteroidales bacterium]